MDSVPSEQQALRKMVALTRDDLETLDPAQVKDNAQIRLHNQLLMHTQYRTKIHREYFTEGRVKNDPFFNNLSVNTTKDEKS